MPGFNIRAALQPLRFPLAVSFALPFSFGGAARPYATSALQPTVTRYLLRKPSDSAPRECPTPLVLVRARGLGLEESNEEEETWNYWAQMFGEKGYTALEVDITAPSSLSIAPESSSGTDGAGSQSSDAAVSPLKAMSTLLASQIRLLAIPFPPIVVASGAASCLLTQAFVEDNPAAALVMLNPPPDADPRPQQAQQAWTWPSFKYEGTFPILVMSDKQGVQRMESSRVGKMSEKGVGRGGKGVSLLSTVDGIRGERTRVVRLDPIPSFFFSADIVQEVERWMDRCGF